MKAIPMFLALALFAVGCASSDSEKVATGGQAVSNDENGGGGSCVARCVMELVTNPGHEAHSFDVQISGSDPDELDQACSDAYADQKAELTTDELSVVDGYTKVENVRCGSSVKAPD